MKFLGSAFKEIAFLVLLAVVTVLPIRLFVAQPFVVEGASMYKTFESGDYLIIDELTYRFSDPKRGDVIVFRAPPDISTFYIKRIIGLPGETVHIDHGKVTITKTDGTTLVLDEQYIIDEDATYSEDATIGSGQYFVMGDNRPKSSDSRVWGLLPEKNIMGRALVRLLPLGQIGLFPGSVSSPQ